MSSFLDYVCLVTGASRGIGKGIALSLADLKATIYITGRTLGSGKDTKGSLEETAAEITARGGKPIPVVVDHSKEDEIFQLFERIQREQRGRLDVLVNNAYAAVPFLLKHNGMTYYEIEDCTPGEAWDTVNDVGLRNHYICATLATRMMLKGRDASMPPGLIVNISSMGGKRYLFNTAYGVGKAAMDRMASDMAFELKRRKANICIISLWPGIVRTEHLSSASGTNISWNMSDNTISESPELSGRVIAALVSESPRKLMARSGEVVLVCDVAHEYGIREPEGNWPPNYRSLQLLMRLGGYNRLSAFVPGFIRLPKSTFMNFVAWHAEPT
ncbi:unnamed protein product [Dicrocoelium dendriticum]|nr:unnamed protein product [Dicrocoelium dendriticum]